MKILNFLQEPSSESLIGTEAERGGRFAEGGGQRLSIEAVMDLVSFELSLDAANAALRAGPRHAHHGKPDTRTQ